MNPKQQAFDRDYYRRFYGFPRGRGIDRRECQATAEFVLSYLRWIDLPVRRLLDMGCGMGYWREALAALRPRCKYLGVESSAFLCEHFGWQQASVLDFTSPTPFDLVICDGVLQYLPAKEAAAAIDNLASLCRGALYLNALTQEDWDRNCDRAATDADVHLRKADWYRRKLRQSFVPVGGCLFVNREAPASMWELGQLR